MHPAYHEYVVTTNDLAKFKSQVLSVVESRQPAGNERCLLSADVVMEVNMVTVQVITQIACERIQINHRHPMFRHNPIRHPIIRLAVGGEAAKGHAGVVVDALVTGGGANPAERWPHGAHDLHNLRQILRILLDGNLLCAGGRVGFDIVQATVEQQHI